MNEIEWCCDGFKAQFENQDGRGLFVALEADSALSEGFRFILGARMIDGDEIEAFAQAAKGLSHIAEHITLDCKTGLRFCPWCGCDLGRHYGKHRRDMVKPGKK